MIKFVLKNPGPLIHSAEIYDTDRKDYSVCLKVIKIHPGTNNKINPVFTYYRTIHYARVGFARIYQTSTTGNQKPIWHCKGISIDQRVKHKNGEDFGTILSIDNRGLAEILWENGSLTTCPTDILIPLEHKKNKCPQCNKEFHPCCPRCHTLLDGVEE